jgi:hemerythrin
MGMGHRSPEPSSCECSGIDREHDIIVKTMAGLHNAVLEGRGGEVIVPLLNLLAQFCAEHFANEEAVMRNYEYAGADTHAAAHETLLRRIMELQARSKEETLPTIVDTMDLLGRLSVHTDRFDREAERCIREAARPHKTRGRRMAAFSGNLKGVARKLTGWPVWRRVWS